MSGRICPSKEYAVVGFTPYYQALKEQTEQLILELYLKLSEVKGHIAEFADGEGRRGQMLP